MQARPLLRRASKPAAHGSEAGRPPEAVSPSRAGWGCRTNFLDKPQESFDRNALIAAIANEFFDMLAHFDRAKIVRDYRARSFILGQQILIFNPAIARAIGRPDNRLSEGIRARAIDIDETGGLVVEYLEGIKSRQMETLSTGEITVRKVYD